MSDKIKWIVKRPWVIHVFSFILMVGVACPRYRVMGGTSIGLWQYGLDSLILAFQLPATLLYMLCQDHLPVLVASLMVWAMALWPLLFVKQRWGYILSYITLIPLWLSYSLGWVFTQSWTGH